MLWKLEGIVERVFYDRQRYSSLGRESELDECAGEDDAERQRNEEEWGDSDQYKETAVQFQVHIVQRDQNRFNRRKHEHEEYNRCLRNRQLREQHPQEHQPGEYGPNR